MLMPRRFSRAAILLASLGAAPALAAPPEIVVTVYRTAAGAERSASAVTVLSRTVIERSSAGSMAELLRTVPGVTVTESGGPGGAAVVGLRGGEAQHTLVMIDGVRVNDPASARGQFDFGLLTPDMIERIEVLRGPQSALYGSDAMGGVINIITRRTGGPARVAVSVEGGSYGTHRESVSLSGGIGPLSALVSGTYFKTNGFSRAGDRDHGEADGTEKFAGSLRLDWDDGGPVRFEFGLDGHRQDSEIDDPGMDNPVGASARDLVNGFARIIYAPPETDHVHSLTGFVTDTRRAFTEDRSPFPRVTRYRGTGFGAEYQGDFSLGAMGTLVAGARIEEERAWQKRGDQASPAFDMSRQFYALFALHRFTLGERLGLSLGARHDGEIGGDGFLTGRATALYDWREMGTKLRGSVGTGAKRPTAFQLAYNPALDIERSIGADFGFDRVLLDGRLTLSATGFYNRFENLIDWNGDFISGTYVNVSAAETAGLELAAEAEIVPGVLRGRASYTLLDARNLDTGLPLARRARHSGSLSLTYTGIDRLSLTATASLVGNRFNDDAATVPLDAYARVDLFADYRLTPTTALYARIENLLDADYREVAGYNTAGLSAYAGLRWRN